MCSLYEKFRKWIQYNGPVLFIAFSIALIVYYPFYSDMLSNPDGVLNWEQMEHPSWMLSQADLSGFILDYLKPKISMVQLPIFFSLAFYCLSGVLLSEIFNVENYCAKLVIAVCVVCSPFVPSTITYPYLAYAFGFYFLLAVVAVKFLVNNQCKLTNILIGGLLLVFLLGGGKTFIGVSTALVLMNFIFATIEDPKRNIENGINLIIQMATVLISAMLFYCILKISLAIAGMSLSTYGGANKITPWHIVVNLPKSIIRAYSDFFDFFFSSNIMINSFNVIFWNKCIFALFVLLFIYYCVCLRDNIVSLFFFILSVVAMPLACNLIDIFAPDYGGITLHMAGGMVVFIPFVFSLTYLFTKSAKTLLKKTKALASILLLCLTWNYIQINCADASLMKITKDLTISAANRVYTQVENDPRYTSDMKLIVYGFPDYSLEWLPYFNKTNNYAHWGMLWSDDFYTAVGWNVIFQHYIDGSVRWGSWDEINSIIMSEEYRAMVPKNGKVNTEIINGIFVVKF